MDIYEKTAVRIMVTILFTHKRLLSLFSHIEITVPPPFQTAIFPFKICAQPADGYSAVIRQQSFYDAQNTLWIIGKTPST